MSATYASKNRQNAPLSSVDYLCVTLPPPQVFAYPIPDLITQLKSECIAAVSPYYKYRYSINYKTAFDRSDR